MYRIIIPILLIAVSFPAFADEDADTNQIVSPDTAPSTDAAKNGPPPSQATDARLSAAASPEKDEIPPDTTLQTPPTPSDTQSTLTIEWGAFSPEPRRPQHRTMTTTGAIVDATAIPGSSNRANPHPVVWKTDTEWVSANMGISTYGASASISFATLRWPSMYWEPIKFFGGAWKRTVHFFGTSTVGMPFWLSARHEFRVGTGIAAGYLRFRQPITEEDSGFAGSGITAAKVKTYVSLPLEARYVYHYRRHLAFELLTIVAFPMNYKIVFEANSAVDPEDYDADYRPFVFAGAGMRF